jgi:hypothetical protein
MLQPVLSNLTWRRSRLGSGLRRPMARIVTSVRRPKGPPETGTSTRHHRADRHRVGATGPVRGCAMSWRWPK